MQSYHFQKDYWEYAQEYKSQQSFTQRKLLSKATYNLESDKMDQIQQLLG